MLNVPAIAAVISLGVLTGAGAETVCGETVRVERGETLSTIAERCDVSEGGLMRSNPRVNGSDDLRVGMELNVPRAQKGNTNTSGFLRSFADEAGDAIGGVARSIGSSVEDLLEKNPDLRQRLRSVGDRLNISGVDVKGAQMTLSPERGPRGTTVTVSASGLPADTPVVVGGGPPRAAYEVIERARTTANGSIRVTVRVPDWASERLVFVVAGAEAGWKVRSEPFVVTGTKL